MWNQHFDEDEVDELEYVKIEVTLLLFFYFLFYYYLCIYHLVFLGVVIFIIILYGSRNLSVFKEMQERREDVQMEVYLKRFSKDVKSKTY